MYQEGNAKAEILASRMRNVLQGKEGIIISRPTKKAELRIRDLEESIEVWEIAQAVAKIGSCG